MQVQWKIRETNETTSLPQLVSCVCQDLWPCKSRWTDLRRFKTDATWFNQISSKEKNINKKGNHDMTCHDKFIDNSKKHLSWEVMGMGVNCIPQSSILLASFLYLLKMKQLEGWMAWMACHFQGSQAVPATRHLPLTLALRVSFRIKLSNMPSVFWTESILVIGCAGWFLCSIKYDNNYGGKAQKYWNAWDLRDSPSTIEKTEIQQLSVCWLLENLSVSLALRQTYDVYFAPLSPEPIAPDAQMRAFPISKNLFRKLRKCVFQFS